MFWSWALLAQDQLTIEPPVVQRQLVVPTRDINHEEVMRVTITNPTRHRLRLRWDKEVVYQPTGWDSYVCDKMASYPTSVTSNVDPLQGVNAPVVLSPGESFDLFLTVLPFRTAGQGKVVITFRNVNRPSEVLGRATFQINFLDPNVSTNIAKGGTRITVYPNPVHDRFFLQNAPDMNRIEVYNTLGKRVKVFEQPQAGDSFPASDLPQGVYLLSLIDKNGQVIRTIRMLRRDFRP